MRLIYLAVLNNILDFMSPNLIVSNHHLISHVYLPFHAPASGGTGENGFGEGGKRSHSGTILGENDMEGREIIQKGGWVGHSSSGLTDQVHRRWLLGNCVACVPSTGRSRQVKPRGRGTFSK